MLAVVWADNGIALSLIRERDFRGADTVLQRALKQNPHRGLRGYILVNLGLSALLATRPEEAATRYRTALEDLDDPISVEQACYRLEGLAASWIAQQTHLFEAATLLAAAAKTRAETGTQPVSDERELVEHATADARRLLPDARYAAAVAAGSAMPIDEAVQYAFGVE